MTLQRTDMRELRLYFSRVEASGATIGAVWRKGRIMNPYRDFIFSLKRPQHWFSRDSSRELRPITVPYCATDARQPRGGPRFTT